jgi:hypothetical protein
MNLKKISDTFNKCIHLKNYKWQILKIINGKFEQKYIHNGNTNAILSKSQVRPKFCNLIKHVQTRFYPAKRVSCSYPVTDEMDTLKYRNYAKSNWN